MRLAIVDLETTAPEPETARIVEIAVALWSVEHHLVETVYSTTIHTKENPAEHVNGIPAAALVDATHIERAFASVGHFVAKADVIVAHNGDGFDRPVLERHACPWVVSKPWLDTMDVNWPKHSTSRALIAIAAAHGVPIGTVHRAIDDVLLVARLFERAAELGADLDAMVAKGLRPKVRVVANVPREQNGVLKEAGFRWDPDRRQWWKRLAAEDVAALPFNVEVAA